MFALWPHPFSSAGLGVLPTSGESLVQVVVSTLDLSPTHYGPLERVMCPSGPFPCSVFIHVNIIHCPDESPVLGSTATFAGSQESGAFLAM